MSSSCNEEVFAVDTSVYMVCGSCGRRFSEEVLPRHFPVCKRIKNKRRKVFVSGVQRANGSDIPIDKVLKPGEIPRPDSKLQLALLKKKNWRRKHLDLLKTIESSRGKKGNNNGRSVVRSPKELPPDYATCNFCKRNFQEDVAKRHIPFCKEIHLRMKFKEKLKQPKPLRMHPNKDATIQQYIYHKQKPYSPRYHQTISLTADCINNSSLTTLPKVSPTLRTGRSLGNYTKAKKDAGCHSSVSRIPRYDTQCQHLKPIEHYDRSILSLDDGDTLSSPSMVNKSVLSREKSSKASPNSYKRTSSGSTREGMAVSYPTARFCFHCGYKYTINVAKYCSNCGTHRLIVDKVRK